MQLGTSMEFGHAQLVILLGLDIRAMILARNAKVNVPGFAGLAARAAESLLTVKRGGFPYG